MDRWRALNVIKVDESDNPKERRKEGSEGDGISSWLMVGFSLLRIGMVVFEIHLARLNDVQPAMPQSALARPAAVNKNDSVPSEQTGRLESRRQHKDSN